MAQSIVEFELHGFEELKRELDLLSKNLQRKGAHAMASSGAAIVRDAAKPKVYKASQEYFSYIEEGKGEYSGMTVKGRSKWGGIRSKFNPSWVTKNIFIGKAKKQKYTTIKWRVFLAPQAWFGRFIEYGGKHNPARPFMRPALSENIPRVLEAMRRALAYFIDEQHFKLLKRTGGTY